MNSPKKTPSRIKGLLSVVLIIQASGGLFLQPSRAGANSDLEQKIAHPSRDGKLLRSEAWQPFDARAATADFFVSPTGNDNWSGALAAPNATSTDGPFATINRAKRAVRELKAKIYQPKEKAIDARYVGTAYPFGKGKDIVVFIRQGFYSLNEPLIFTAKDAARGLSISADALRQTITDRNDR